MLTFTKYYYKNPSRLQQPKKQICTKIRIKTHGGLMRPLASYNKVVNGSRWRFCIVNTSSSLFLRLQLYLYSWGYIFIFILEATSLSLFLRLHLYLYFWGYIFIFILDSERVDFNISNKVNTKQLPWKTWFFKSYFLHI